MSDEEDDAVTDDEGSGNGSDGNEPTAAGGGAPAPVERGESFKKKSEARASAPQPAKEDGEDSFEPLVFSLDPDVPPRVLSKNSRMLFRISGPSSRVVRAAFRRAGFVQTTGSDWNAMWGKPLKAAEFRGIEDYQRVNHFPGTYELGRKDRLYRNYSRHRRLFGSEAFSYLPKTFLIPQDWDELQTDMLKSNSIYIVKPKASSRGRGIRMIKSITEIPKDSDQLLVQRYLSNPCLVNGYKFDIRLYAAVLCFDPLRLYLCKEGLVRFCTQKYDISPKSFKNKMRHLTNYSVQKHSEDFQQNEDASNDGSGSKWSLTALFAHLRAQGVDTEKLWASMVDLTVKTYLSVESQINTYLKIAVPNRSTCFELHGLDVMLDENMKPWLIEVNTSPSLHSESPLDKKIKSEVINDLFNMVAFTPIDREAYRQQQEAGKAQRLMGAEKTLRSSDQRVKRHGVTSGISTIELADLSNEDRDLILQAEREMTVCGNYERIFPSPTCAKYMSLFDTRRYSNLLLVEWTLRSHPEHRHMLNQMVAPSPPLPLGPAAASSGSSASSGKAIASRASTTSAQHHHRASRESPQRRPGQASSSWRPQSSTRTTSATMDKAVRDVGMERNGTASKSISSATKPAAVSAQPLQGEMSTSQPYVAKVFRSARSREMEAVRTAFESGLKLMESTPQPRLSRPQSAAVCKEATGGSYTACGGGGYTASGGGGGQEGSTGPAAVMGHREGVIVGVAAAIADGGHHQHQHHHRDGLVGLRASVGSSGPTSMLAGLGRPAGPSTSDRPNGARGGVASSRGDRRLGGGAAAAAPSSRPGATNVGGGGGGGNRAGAGPTQPGVARPMQQFEGWKFDLSAASRPAAPLSTVFSRRSA